MPLRLLKFFCNPDYHADIEGDLLELYERDLEKSGKRKADMLLLRNVLRLLRPGLLRTFNTNPFNRTLMLKHNLLISLRNFMRYKTSFIVNVTGLSTGLACVLLIFLWVSDERAMDQFHVNKDRLYQVIENVNQNGGLITRESTSGPMSAALVAEMPEVEMAATATVNWTNEKVVSVGEVDTRATELFADKQFFQMFSLPLVEGDPATVLNNKTAVVISESLAGRLFKSGENPLGKVIEVGHEKSYQVTGIMQDLPKNSSMSFDYVLSFDGFRDDNEWCRSWFNTAPQTYVLLREGASVDEFNKKIADLIRTKTEGKATHRTPYVRLYADAYLYNRYEEGQLAGGRIEYVKLLSIVALFILLIACINFMNLSTARASRRIKEVGIKKVVGARQGSLIGQYLSEATFVAFFSLLIAILLVFLLLPQFNIITGKNLTLSLDTRYLIYLPIVMLLTGIVAGSYPAFYLSRFRPAAVLKGKLTGAFGETLVRKGLVAFQFCLSILLIVSVLVVYRQIEFTQTRNLGYDKDNVLMFSREGQVYQQQDAFLNEARRIPGVIAASSSGHDMTGHNGGTYGISWPGKNPDDLTEFERVTANFGLIELLGMEIKEGRSFSADREGEDNKIIFNETAIAYMGIEDPIGKKVNFSGEENEIIGVVKDFNFESFHESVKPLFIFVEPRYTGNIMVKIERGKEQQAIAQLQDLYSQFNSGFPFTYRFLDDDYQELYTAELRVAQLSKYFASLAIIISCLGLFGLAAFTAERRVKEIGIRKVLGSSSFGIVFLLSSEFTRLVVIAMCGGLPLSWYFAQLWLGGFVYRIDLDWWIFAASGISALLIAWLSVAFTTIKTATVSPARCLRSE